MMNFYGTETSSHTCELLKYAFMIISASWGTLLITPFSLIKKAPCDYAENYALIYEVMMIMIEKPQNFTFCNNYYVIVLSLTLSPSSKRNFFDDPEL